MKNKIQKIARDVAGEFVFVTMKVFSLVRRYPVTTLAIVAVVIGYVVNPWIGRILIGVLAVVAWLRYSGQLRVFINRL